MDEAADEEEEEKEGNAQGVEPAHAGGLAQVSVPVLLFAKLLGEVPKRTTRSTTTPSIRPAALFRGPACLGYFAPLSAAAVATKHEHSPAYPHGFVPSPASAARNSVVWRSVQRRRRRRRRPRACVRVPCVCASGGGGRGLNVLSLSLLLLLVREPFLLLFLPQITLHKLVARLSARVAFHVGALALGVPHRLVSAARPSATPVHRANNTSVSAQGQHYAHQCTAPATRMSVHRALGVTASNREQLQSAPASTAASAALSAAVAAAAAACRLQPALGTRGGAGWQPNISRQTHAAAAPCRCSIVCSY